jgi:hypothetical protein
MVNAHGDYCDDFPAPTQPMQFHPFFGKYSSTGKRGTGTYDYGQGTTGTGGTTNGQGYDPRYYESPPQGQPKVQSPGQEQLAPPAQQTPQDGQGQGGGAGPNNNGQ